MACGIALVAAVLALATQAVAASRCEGLSGSSDGVPAGYYREECRGRTALEAGDAPAAARHFRMALQFALPDAANYLLRPDLAEALCRQGQVVEAQGELQLFQCMAAVESGLLACPLDSAAPPACARLCSEPRPLACTAHVAMLPDLRRYASMLARDCEDLATLSPTAPETR